MATGAIAILVAGCSSTGRDRVARPTQPTRPAATTQVTTGVTKPLATTPLARRQIGRITIDNADGLVAALGFIWVKTDDGRLVKVDPRTNRIVGQRKLDTATDSSRYCQGIGTDGKSVWACATTDTATDVVQVDPTSLAPVQRVRVNKVFDQLRLPFAGDKLWVLGADGSSLIGVDPATAAVTSRKLRSGVCSSLDRTARSWPPAASTTLCCGSIPHRERSAPDVRLPALVSPLHRGLTRG